MPSCSSSCCQSSESSEWQTKHFSLCLLYQSFEVKWINPSNECIWMYLLRITEISPSYILGLISVTLTIYINPPEEYTLNQALCISLFWAVMKSDIVHLENLFELCYYQNQLKKIFNLVYVVQLTTLSLKKIGFFRFLE